MIYSVDQSGSGPPPSARSGARVVAIVGPTATGKTAVAVELAHRIGAEIVSADSMAVYRGMDIGTAKPTADELRRARFHMVDVVDPGELFTVSDFQDRAVKIIDDLLEQGVVPLLVGGTGLYVRSIIDGLNIPGPGPIPEIRERLEKAAEEHGGAYLHCMLAGVDPETAERLHPNDLKRIIRALEVYEHCGAPMSEVVKRSRAKGPRYPDAMLFGLAMDRKALYQRIEERVDRMIEDGLVGEVAGLLEKGYNTEVPAMQGLGYKEIAGHLEGRYSLAEAIDALKQGTRRFAKRQYTWFRADERINWLDVDELSAPELADIIEAKLRDAGVIGQDVG